MNTVKTISLRCSIIETPLPERRNFMTEKVKGEVKLNYNRFLSMKFQ